MSEPEVITRLEGPVGRITLNRADAVHALTLGMCQTITAELIAWRSDPGVALVLIDHAGERGFCAGGEIRTLAESGVMDSLAARALLFAEYRMNALMAAWPKPMAVVMDGIVMGGGAGISLPCRYRITTENTTFAMPETGIGLFPDAGGGWHLPRLPGESGMWLALTGARIRAADCALLGIATNHVSSTDTPALKAAIVADPSAVETLLDRYKAEPGEPRRAAHRAEMDRAFAAESVEAILAALEREGTDWARAQLDTLKVRSPQTLKVAFRQLRAGRALTSFEANMAMEYRIAARVVCRHDFFVGVRAIFADKARPPIWSPATLEGVTEAMLDEIFAPLPPNEEWTPL